MHNEQPDQYRSIYQHESYLPAYLHSGNSFEDLHAIAFITPMVTAAAAIPSGVADTDPETQSPSIIIAFTTISALRRER